MKKYKQNLDILKFNNITKITNKKMIALGGINLKNAVEEFERGLITEAPEKTNWVKNKAAIFKQ